MFDLTTLLSQIKEEAERLIKTDRTLGIEAAYQAAIVKVFIAAAERPKLTPFEAQVLAVMNGLSEDQRAGSRSFLKGDISTALQLKGMEIDDWTLWHTLSKLEEKRQVHRPRGPRSRKWAVYSLAA